MSLFCAKYETAWIGCLLVSMLSVAEPASAQPSAQLAGSVRDATDLPLAGATITVRGPADRVVQTGPDGQFDLQTLPEGEYELTATLAGFAPARRTFGLTSGERSVVALTLSVQILEQAVVTATKAGEADVQTTPMAVSTLSGMELQRAEAHTVAQIAGLAPSVTFSQNTDFAQLTIRG